MLHLRLLGGLSVESGGAPVKGSAAQPRRLALLAVIARSGTRGVTRERLQALLWPDLGDERARRILAHALYALRRDLGAETAISGRKELALDPAVISCDLLDFEAALGQNDLERAAAHYGGPFLHGFRLSNSPEFDRWADDERTSLEHRYLDILEKLGREAARAGDAEAAVRWWRRAAAQDPLNARFTTELMHALVAAGNVAGALQQARVYEALVEEELSLPPDREVVRLVQQIREHASAHPLLSHAAADREAASEPARAAVADGATSAVLLAASEPGPQRRRPRYWYPVLALTALVAIVALGILTMARLRAREQRAAGNEAIVVIGAIRDHRTAQSTEGLGPVADLLATSLARAQVRTAQSTEGLGPVADLLATSLARAQGLRVISTARVYELLAQMGGDLQHPTPADIAGAARLAGASQLIDGGVYSLPDGRLRLDLRRIRLPAGELMGSYTIVGGDLFALVDSGTVRFVRDAGARLAAGSIADVTTSSEVAYRFFEEGLRQYFRSDFDHAHRQFEAALREDSTFAMAAFYGGQAANWVDAARSAVLFDRARKLAHHASDRERLTILAGFALKANHPSGLAVAETLAVRYPLELEGHLYLGSARIRTGQAEAALDPLRRVVSLDSLAFKTLRPRCLACDALDNLSFAYSAIDSSAAALRYTKRWTELQPESPRPWLTLAFHQVTLGQTDDAARSLRRVTDLDATMQDNPGQLAYFWIRQDRADVAEAEIRRLGATAVVHDRLERLWFLAIALREQGKLRAALAAAHEARRTRTPPPDTVSTEAILTEAQVLLEAGQPQVAAAVLDSFAHTLTAPWPSARASATAWVLAHRASALFAAGDTNALAELADSVELIGRRALDRQHLHHYARGLLYFGRNDLEKAAQELRAALPTGLTRARYHLAQVLLRMNRPSEAVSQLQVALRGSIEGGGFYTTRTHLHEALAIAWERANRADSAAAHYRIVVRSWRQADPPLRSRREAAARRLQALERSR